MQIEKGVPVPESTNGKSGRTGIGRPRKYPFEDMEVGDSIFVEGQTMRGGAYKSARRYTQKTGVAFTAHLEKGGIRIWRAE